MNDEQFGLLLQNFTDDNRHKRQLTQMTHYSGSFTLCGPGLLASSIYKKLSDIARPRQSTSI